MVIPTDYADRSGAKAHRALLSFIDAKPGYVVSDHAGPKRRKLDLLVRAHQNPPLLTERGARHDGSSLAMSMFNLCRSYGIRESLEPDELAHKGSTVIRPDYLKKINYIKDKNSLTCQSKINEANDLAKHAESVRYQTSTLELVNNNVPIILDNGDNHRSDGVVCSAPESFEALTVGTNHERTSLPNGIEESANVNRLAEPPLACVESQNGSDDDRKFPRLPISPITDNEDNDTMRVEDDATARSMSNGRKRPRAGPEVNSPQSAPSDKKMRGARRVLPQRVNSFKNSANSRQPGLLDVNYTRRCCDTDSGNGSLRGANNIQSSFRSPQDTSEILALDHDVEGGPFRDTEPEASRLSGNRHRSLSNQCNQSQQSRYGRHDQRLDDRNDAATIVEQARMIGKLKQDNHRLEFERSPRDHLESSIKSTAQSIMPVWSVCKENSLISVDDFSEMDVSKNSSDRKLHEHPTTDLRELYKTSLKSDLITDRKQCVSFVQKSSVDARDVLKSLTAAAIVTALNHKSHLPGIFEPLGRPEQFVSSVMSELGIDIVAFERVCMKARADDERFAEIVRGHAEALAASFISVIKIQMEGISDANKSMLELDARFEIWRKQMVNAFTAALKLKEIFAASSGRFELFFPGPTEAFDATRMTDERPNREANGPVAITVFPGVIQRRDDEEDVVFCKAVVLRNRD